MSTRKLLLLWIALLTFMASPFSALGAEVVRGTGIHRFSADECLDSLPAFTRKLQSAGLKLTKPVECQEVLGEPEAYEPIFEAESEVKMVAETAVPGYSPTREGCASTLRDMLPVVADPGEIIVESGCVPLTLANPETGETERNYQPMVFLLKKQQ